MDEQSIADVRFGGHQTFALRIAWLPKAAQAIDAGRDPLSDPMNGVVELGLGKNMVEALRCWIEAYGVATREGSGWKLTAEGRLIFGQDGLDRFLEDPQTLWWLHWRVTTRRSAPFFAWELMFNRWNEPTFSGSEVIDAFAREARYMGRKLSDVTLKQHFEVWLRTYATPRGSRVLEDGLDSPLAALELVRRAGERETGGRREPVYALDRSPKRSISQALFRFALDDWWRATQEEDDTAPFTSVASARGSPGRVLRMPEAEVRDRLVQLSREPASGYTIVESLNQHLIRRDRSRASSSLTLLRRVYDRAPTPPSVRELAHA